MFRAVTGDETGLGKLVDLKGKRTVSKWGRQSRKHGVVRMAWAPGQRGHSTVATLTASGVVELWDPLAGAQLSSISGVDANSAYLAAVGEEALLAVSKDGRVQVFSPSARDASEASAAAAGGAGAGAAAVRTHEFSVGPRVAAARLAPGGGMLAVGGRDHDLQLWDVTTGKQAWAAKNVPRDWLDRVQPIWVAALSFFPTSMRDGIVRGDFTAAMHGRTQSELAGVGNLVSEEQAAGWASMTDAAAAAAARERALGAGTVSSVLGAGAAAAAAEAAERKVRKAAAKGGAGAGAAAAAAAGAALAEAPAAAGPDYLLAACTGYSQVRIYDARAAAAPVLNVDMGEAPFTACAATLDGKHLITGDTLGNLRRLDMRTLRQTGGYHGAAGSVREIAVHPGGKPYVAAVGLDRFLRVFHIHKREQVRSVYLKQRLTALLWDAPVQSEAEREAEAAAAAAKKAKAKAAEAAEIQDRLMALHEADLDSDDDDGDSDGGGTPDTEGDDDESLHAEERGPARLQITNFPKADRLFQLKAATPEGSDADEDDDEEEREGESDDENGSAGDDDDDDELSADDDDAEDEDEAEEDAGAAGAASAPAAGKKARGSKAAAMEEEDDSDDDDDLSADGDDDGDDDDYDSLLDFDDDDDDDDEDEDDDDSDGSADTEDGGGKKKKPAAGKAGKGKAGAGAGKHGAKRPRRGAGGGDGEDDDRTDLLLGEGARAAEMRKALKVERKRLEKVLPQKKGGKGKAAPGGGGKRR